MRRMERYLKRKELSPNTEKPKIISFRKGGGRRMLMEVGKDHNRRRSEN